MRFHFLFWLLALACQPSVQIILYPYHFRLIYILSVLKSIITHLLGVLFIQTDCRVPRVFPSSSVYIAYLYVTYKWPYLNVCGHVTFVHVPGTCIG